MRLVLMIFGALFLMIALFSNVNPLRTKILPKLVVPGFVDIFLISCVLGLIGLYLVIRGLFNFRKIHLIKHTPTSAIGMISQNGIYEIKGSAFAKQSYLAPISKQECVWYKLVFQTRNKYNQWVRYSEYEPQDPGLLIKDASGTMLLDSSFINTLKPKVIESMVGNSSMITDPNQVDQLIKSHPDLKNSFSVLSFMNRFRVVEYCILPGQQLNAYGYVQNQNLSMMDHDPEKIAAAASSYSPRRMITKFGYPAAFSFENQEKFSSVLKTESFSFALVGLIMIVAPIVFGLNLYKNRYVSWKSGFNSAATGINFTPLEQTFSENIESEPNDNPNFWSTFPEHAQIKVNEPVELDGLSKNDVLKIRVNAVNTSLPKYNYKPLPAIFEQIQDGKPWWGWHGILFFGGGTHSPAGPSFRSNSIVNPLALVWPSFWEQNLTASKLWHPAKVPSTEEQAANFKRLQPTASDIDIDPVTKTVSIHYNVSEFNQYLADYTVVKIDSGIFINLDGMNARDLGFPFFMFNPYKSTNMSKMNKDQTVSVKLQEFYHVGGSCGFPDGCNNLSPFQAATTNYIISNLPALAEFKLWHKKPAHFKDAPDVTYKIYFD